MPRAKPPSESVLTRAAAARAEGNSWNVVGEIVGRSPGTVRRWPERYPERWDAAMQAADRRVVADAAAEAVCVLRQLIRSDDAKVRQRAAWNLVFQRLELSKLALKAAALAPKPPPTEAQAIAAFVEAHTDEELMELAAHIHNTPVPECLGVQDQDATGAE